MKCGDILIYTGGFGAHSYLIEFDVYEVTAVFVGGGVIRDANGEEWVTTSWKWFTKVGSIN